ncbi:MAG: hypothetical protein KA715_04625 [Xanthomonadaceae bacterium]|nr:hypothetical protein [Xanthomonadaceae bacterium]
MIFLSIFAVHADARAPHSIRKLRPNWVKPHSWVTSVNRSYLDCFKCDLKKQMPKSFVESMLDPQLVEGYRADFYVYQNQIEQKQNFGLLNSPKLYNQIELAKFDPNGAKVVNIYDRNQSLTQTIKDRALDDGMESQIQDIQNGPAARAVDETASSLGKVIKSMNQGQPVVAKAENPFIARRAGAAKSVSSRTSNPAVLTPKKVDWIDAQFGAKSDFEGMRGQVFMKSKLVNTEVDVVAHRPLTESLNVGYLGSKIVSKMNLGNGLDRQNAETARFRLYRNIPLIEVHASWMYGLSSNTMTSSISKQFTAFLRAELTRVDHFNGTPDQRAGLFLERTF